MSVTKTKIPVSRRSIAYAHEHLIKKLAKHNGSKSLKIQSLEHIASYDSASKAFFESENQHREEVARILKLDPKDRSTQNINTLKSYFADNQYLRKQAQLYEDKTMQYLYREMRFLEMATDDRVFEFGDEGNHFYIIMEGEVIIETPV